MRNVFIVDDEALIRMMTAGMIEELGHRVIAEAAIIRDAEQLAQTVSFDLAILDINLDGEYIYPVALIVERRGIPFLFASGNNTSGLPEPFRDKSVLRKPFFKVELRRAIDVLLQA